MRLKGIINWECKGTFGPTVRRPFVSLIHFFMFRRFPIHCSSHDPLGTWTTFSLPLCVTARWIMPRRRFLLTTHEPGEDFERILSQTNSRLSQLSCSRLAGHVTWVRIMRKGVENKSWNWSQNFLPLAKDREQPRKLHLFPWKKLWKNAITKIGCSTGRCFLYFCTGSWNGKRKYCENIKPPKVVCWLWHTRGRRRAELCCQRASLIEWKRKL